MKTTKTTKRALISSVISLLVCFTMLLGTTYAWFTDSAVSANNKINAGTLDVELYQWTDAATSVAISESKAPVFDNTILWEPGRTETVYLSIKNNGNLNLKYKVAIEVTDVTYHNLADVMEYVVTPNATYGTVSAWAGNGLKVENAPGTNETNYKDIELAPGSEHFFALSIHMIEEATNEYMGESITFDIRVLAGQTDANASYSGTGYSAPIAPGQSAAEVRVTDDQGYKVASVVIPAEAAKEGEKIAVDVKESYYDANISVAAGSTTKAYDVTVTGLKDNNTQPVKVSLNIGKNYNPADVKIFHYTTEIPCTYNPNTGYVTFETATFSPFTVVHPEEANYVAPTVTPEMDRPTATVVYLDQYVGEDKITWGSYGQWSPTTGLDSDLETCVQFTCPKNLDPEVEAAFENWYCDFYVSLDKALAPNQIFLGGNYGSFGWVGFHNGELTLDANQELALLGSVTSNPWTYADVRDYVGTFICGVGDVDDALNGATFTVKLRLTNPANEAEFYDVNVVTHTFGAGTCIDGETVVLSNDIDLNNPENADWLNGLMGNN